jgi:hypothetical protein
MNKLRKLYYNLTFYLWWTIKIKDYKDKHRLQRMHDGDYCTYKTYTKLLKKFK